MDFDATTDALPHEIKSIIEGWADAVAFGKLFIANPDLPRRFASGAALNAWDAGTFYVGGSKGYTDYPALQPQ